MPQKKPKPQERTPVYIRFSAQELGPIESDRKAMPGVPVTLGIYAKHAVVSYPKLRKIADALKAEAQDAVENGNSADSESIYAMTLLQKAGL